jgi:hypothetical protein
MAKARGQSGPRGGKGGRQAAAGRNSKLPHGKAGHSLRPSAGGPTSGRKQSTKLSQPKLKGVGKPTARRKAPPGLRDADAAPT